MDVEEVQELKGQQIVVEEEEKLKVHAYPGIRTDGTRNVTTRVRVRLPHLPTKSYPWGD